MVLFYENDNLLNTFGLILLKCCILNFSYFKIIVFFINYERNSCNTFQLIIFYISIVIIMAKIVKYAVYY